MENNRNWHDDDDSDGDFDSRFNASQRFYDEQKKQMALRKLQNLQNMQHNMKQSSHKIMYGKDTVPAAANKENVHIEYYNDSPLASMSRIEGAAPPSYSYSDAPGGGYVDNPGNSYHVEENNHDDSDDPFPAKPQADKPRSNGRQLPDCCRRRCVMATVAFGLALFLIPLMAGLLSNVDKKTSNVDAVDSSTAHCKPGRIKNIKEPQLELVLAGFNQTTTDMEQFTLGKAVSLGYNDVSLGCQDAFERWMFDAVLVDQVLIDFQEPQEQNGKTYQTALVATFLTRISCDGCSAGKAFASTYPASFGQLASDEGHSRRHLLQVLYEPSKKRRWKSGRRGQSEALDRRDLRETEDNPLDAAKILVAIEKNIRNENVFKDFVGITNAAITASSTSGVTMELAYDEDQVVSSKKGKSGKGSDATEMSEYTVRVDDPANTKGKGKSSKSGKGSSYDSSSVEDPPTVDLPGLQVDTPSLSPTVNLQGIEMEIPSPTSLPSKVPTSVTLVVTGDCGSLDKGCCAGHVGTNLTGDGNGDGCDDKTVAGQSVSCLSGTCSLCGSADQRCCVFGAIGDAEETISKPRMDGCFDVYNSAPYACFVNGVASEYDGTCLQCGSVGLSCCPDGLTTSFNDINNDGCDDAASSCQQDRCESIIPEVILPSPSSFPSSIPAVILPSPSSFPSTVPAVVLPSPSSVPSGVPTTVPLVVHESCGSVGEFCCAGNPGTILTDDLNGDGCIDKTVAGQFASCLSGICFMCGSADQRCCVSGVIGEQEAVTNPLLDGCFDAYNSVPHACYYYGAVTQYEGTCLQCGAAGLPCCPDGLATSFEDNNNDGCDDSVNTCLQGRCEGPATGPVFRSGIVASLGDGVAIGGVLSTDDLFTVDDDGFLVVDGNGVLSGQFSNLIRDYDTECSNTYDDIFISLVCDGIVVEDSNNFALDSSCTVSIYEPGFLVDTSVIDESCLMLIRRQGSPIDSTDTRWLAKSPAALFDSTITPSSGGAFVVAGVESTIPPFLIDRGFVLIYPMGNLFASISGLRRDGDGTDCSLTYDAVFLSLVCDGAVIANSTVFDRLACSISIFQPAFVDPNVLSACDTSKILIRRNGIPDEDPNNTSWMAST